MNRVYLDFETRSAVDLRKQGVAIYAQHPTTDIMCLCFWAPGTTNLVTLTPYDFQMQTPNFMLLMSLANLPDYIFIAHNAEFEQYIWKYIMVARYGFPELEIERWRCTMAKSNACGLPAALKDVAKVLNLDTQKDLEGQKSMLVLSKPRTGKKFAGKVVFWEYKDRPDDFKIMYSYCGDDVRTEKELDEELPDLTAREQRVWFLDQKINQRGVLIDREMVKKAIALGNEDKQNARNEFANGCDFLPTQRAKFAEYLGAQGVQVPDTTKPTLEKVKLSHPELSNEIDLFLSANKTSLAKFPSMLARSSSHGRAHSLFAYHSAHTGRWGGRGIQVQNLARTQYSTETLISAINSGDLDFFSNLYADVSGALSSAIRPMLIAGKFKRFFVGDFSSIESRVLNWLFGQEDVLENFRQGLDPYLVAASQVYGRTITKADKDERSIGKIGELALGYEGGIAAYAKFAEAYQIDLRPIVPGIWRTTTQEERDKADWHYMLYAKKAEDAVSKEVGMACNVIKERWRTAHPNVTAGWRSVEAAAIKAVRTKQIVECGRLKFFMSRYFLCCRLPSGRDIRYPFPKVVDNSRSSKLTFKTQDVQRGWCTETTYGGRLTENIVQAISRDLLVEAMFDMEDAGYEIVMHVHDETVAEVDEDFGDLETYLNFLRRANRKWAPDLPMGAEGAVMYRYRKG